MRKFKSLPSNRYGLYILQCIDSETLLSTDDALAEGKLLAAAPELLEALEACHAVLWNGYPPESPAAESARAMALAAICKARGEKL